MARSKHENDLQALANAETVDFVEMIRLAGLDPKCDFRHTDLSETALGEADVEDWDFTGTNLDGANLSRVKNITKAHFSEETSLVSTRLPDGVDQADLIG